MSVSHKCHSSAGNNSPNFPLKMQYIRRLNTKSLPRGRSEETTPNLLGKEIEIKVALKAEPVSQ